MERTYHAPIGRGSLGPVLETWDTGVEGTGGTNDGEGKSRLDKSH